MLRSVADTHFVPSWSSSSSETKPIPSCGIEGGHCAWNFSQLVWVCHNRRTSLLVQRRKNRLRHIFEIRRAKLLSISAKKILLCTFSTERKNNVWQTKYMHIPRGTWGSFLLYMGRWEQQTLSSHYDVLSHLSCSRSWLCFKWRYLLNKNGPMFVEPFLPAEGWRFFALFAIFRSSALSC